MERLFQTHAYRKVTELSGRMWKFSAPGMPDELVGVPSCWETYPGYENYKGTVAYQTEFEAEGNCVLEFKGVSHNARVYVDDNFVGEHYGSYTAFRIYLKGLRMGWHVLKVVVDNRLTEEYSLDFPNDYMSYGGISRPVFLHQVNECIIEQIHITPCRQNGKDWHVKVEVWCSNFSDTEQERELELVVEENQLLSTVTRIPVGRNQKVLEEELIIKDAKMWSIQSPDLYLMKAFIRKKKITEDDYFERFGLRIIQIENGQVCLNETPIYIKGFCRHEDHPSFGCAIPFELMQQDLQLIKDMGANSIRTSHYPNDERFLDLCDEMGILVWEENHARGMSEEQMRNPRFEMQCEKVIEEMISQHYNHPSIYVWGILNECASDTEYGRTCYQKQYELIGKLDKSRPRSSASCKFFTDICQDLPDICSWNMYPYWYDGESATEKLEKTYQWLQGEGNGKGKPFLITEVGAGAVYGFHDRAHDVWSEERQADIIRKQLTEIAGFPHCMGMYIWQFCDVRVSREWALNRPKSRNNKGIVDEYRRPKLGYDVVKSIFREIQK